LYRPPRAGPKPGREAAERANILRPLAHFAFLVTWQDELAAFAPAPAVIIANLATRRRWAWFANLAIAGGAILLVGLSGLYHLLLAALGQEPALPPAILVAAAALATPVLFTAVRRRLARVLPLDPESPVALLALVAVLLIVGVQVNYQASHDALAAVNAAAQLQPIDVVAQEIPILLLAFLGVGLFTRRPLPATLERLGIVRPAPWQVCVALAVAGLFVAISQGAEYLQQLLDPALAHRLSQVTSHYYAGITGVIGISVIAIAPGVAEESFFRGALQPRLGVLLAALAFAAIHTQYALTIDTLLVFTLGCGLGLVRRQLNTTAAIVSHAVYNALAGIGIPDPLLPWAIAAETVVVAAAFGLWYLGRRDSAPVAQAP
jgi:membrane protease YdiL (CAAX protease family)